MKKLIFLLILPSLCYSQSYEELMQINSEKIFVRYMVENGFTEGNSSNSSIKYLLNIRQIGEIKYMDVISEYFKSEGIFTITFAFDRPTAKNIYNNIYNQIKDKCNYLTSSDGSVFYSCKWEEAYKKLIVVENVHNAGTITSGINIFDLQWEFKL
tara:strand:+ start:83 stop:547 length:465 start_codon:yes stop_codon:yes gene_type:complete